MSYMLRADEPSYQKWPVLNRARSPGPSAENPLQSAAMHIEATRSLRHVATAGLMDLLDMLQAYRSGRHGMLWRLSFAPKWRLQRRDDVVRVHWFRKIVDGAEFYCLHGSRNVAVAGQNDRARIGPLLPERRDDVQAAPVTEPHVYHGVFRYTLLNSS